MKPGPLFDSVQYLKGVGPQKNRLLNQLGIFKIRDLLYYFPFRHEDRRCLKTINQLEPGVSQSFRAEVLAKGLRKIGGGRSIFQAALGDETGRMNAVWFNQPYIKDIFKIGDSVIFYGKIQLKKQLQVVNPEYELIDSAAEQTLHTDRIVPVYSLAKGVSQRVLRKLCYSALNQFAAGLEDFLPQNIRKKYNLIGLSKAICDIHFPAEMPDVPEARKRLVYEELFGLQFRLAYKKYFNKYRQAHISFELNDRLVLNFIKRLPFHLTSSQMKVISEIKADLSAPCRMQRLLQGDVGSGKTVVALTAALYVISAGYQVALMAPTEVLVEQHYRTIKNLLGPLKVSTSLLTSQKKASEKKAVLGGIERHKIDLIVGTHALIQKEVFFKKLGLVIIDEQHKFGVIQRQALYQKGQNPDLLIMTATPIPRTLAYSLYGDLDISVINTLPAGRKKITTWWVTKKKIEGAYNFIKQEVKKGRQAYIVYPLVEESNKIELKAAVKMYSHLSRDIFKEHKVGLIHGQMKADKKERIILEFKDNKFQILVSTVVIEVGIDVANASVMLIEHAERFGLSQLHQLRGRIGRGPHESYCILVSSAAGPNARRRLAVMSKVSSGFKIADEDMALRGPGDFFGLRQHGLWGLKIADFIKDEAILENARKDVLGLFTKPDFIKSAPGKKIFEHYAAPFI